MDERIHGPLVTFCFDGGRESAATEGARILEQYGVRGTYYPIASKVGMEDEDGWHASWETLRALERAMHEIGNHSFSSDRGWIGWPWEKQRDDIAEADSTFNVEGGLYTPRTFAYPFGLHTPALQRVVEDYRRDRYIAARTTEPGINRPDADPFALRSFLIERAHDLEDVARMTEMAKDERGWLILTFRHLDDRTFFSTPPERFAAMVRTTLRRGLTPVTLYEGAFSFLEKARKIG